MSERVGMLGGTFDPVHIGHLVLGEAAREELGLDRVIFVPTGHSWRKTDREITPAAGRLEMLRLAVAGNPHFEVSTLEVEREGPSYSEITLAALQEANPGAELFFILGRDALADLPNWHDPRRVVELATLAVAERGDMDSPLIEDPALARLNARIAWLPMPEIGVSATDVRARAAAGRSLRYLVPDSVAEYIARHRLYQA
ncbi:MAG TPA: nicotinate-nucleotide adenylyltransferase [Dehalococcoidia bacterium]|nr:nicotinate-nucleotide adenylyltransferase [Dehalococcoidia bacterium]